MNRLDELKRNAPPLDDITVEVDSDRGMSIIHSPFYLPSTDTLTDALTSRTC